AMVAAANAALGDPTELERAAPMATLWLEYADPSGAITEEDEILTEDPDEDRRVAELVGEAERRPEPSQAVSPRRTSPAVRELSVLWSWSVRVFAVGCPQEVLLLRHARDLPSSNLR